MRDKVTTFDSTCWFVCSAFNLFVLCGNVVFQKSTVKTMTRITDGGDLKQLNEFLSQQKMKSLFHLIDSSGPAHCPLFTMRLSICDQAGKNRNRGDLLRLEDTL